MVATMTSQREAFGRALVDLGAVDGRVVVIDADLASSTKVDFFQAAYPDRFFQVGVAEQNMMGIAAGLATMGFVPFTSTFACFAATRVTDQIRASIAQPHLPVVSVGAYSGLIVGKVGKTHQAVEDIAVMRALPGMTVLAPGDAVETREAVFAAAALGAPVYLRLTRDPCPAVFGDDYEFKVGRAARVRDGGDVAIVTTGEMVSRALEAATALAAEGIEALVVHMPTVKPLDEAALVAAADKTGLVVTAEEHSVVGGLGAAVAETLGEQRPTPMRRVGIADTYGESAPNDALLEKYGLTSGHIAQAVRALIHARTASPQATA